MRLLFALPWLLAIDTQLAGCEVAGCSSIGCDNHAQITLDTALDPASFDGGRAQICRNDACTEVDLVVDGTHVTVTTYRRNDVVSHFDFSGRDVGSQVVMSVDVMGGGVFPGGLVDGDEYTIDLWDSVGTPLGSYRWEARYADAHAGGQDCAPVCRSTVLDNTNAL